MSAHTPEPWHHHGGNSVRVCNGKHDSEEGCSTIVEAEILNVPREEAAANARLIAAAPDLLAACKAIRETCPTDNDVTARFDTAWQLMIAAIAKAEGAP